MKPDKYPLPWCDWCDEPYYKLNLYLISTKEGWLEKQSHVPMAEIIPWIDALIEEGSLKLK